MTVRPRQLERVGNLVHVSVEEGEYAVEAEPAALRVVIVNKHQSITGTQLAPAFAVVPQVRQTLVAIAADHVTDVLAVSEFRHSPNEHVLVGMDCLALVTHVANLGTH